MLTEASPVERVDFRLSSQFQLSKDSADNTFYFEYAYFDCERSSESTSFYADAVQVLQLAVWKHSCPIFRPILWEISDLELSHNDAFRTGKSQSDSTDRSEAAFETNELSDGREFQGSSNPELIDEKNSTSNTLS